MLSLACVIPHVFAIHPLWRGSHASLPEVVAIRQYVMKEGTETCCEAFQKALLDEAIAAKFERLVRHKRRRAVYKFMKHVLKSESFMVMDETLFELVMRFHDGRCSTRGYGNLVRMLAAGTRYNGSWPSSWIAPTSAWSLQTISMLYSRPPRTSLLARENKTAASPARQPHASWRTEDTVSLDWPRFQELAAKVANFPGFRGRGQALRAKLVSKQTTEQNLVKLVSRLGGAVVNHAGLTDFAKYVTTSEMSAEALLAQLFAISSSEHGWVRFGGEYAPLEQAGYEALLYFTSSDVFQPFAHRIAHSRSLFITDEQALQAFLQFHNGKRATSSFAELEGGLLSSANLTSFCGGGWIVEKRMTEWVD